ncbi:amidase domain-containing protein [Clostridium sp. P21]|uniref:Amidase domain-containing protein n=1 Tax=Clostridium muellerianum TaxID=2716538 RepID=A0A7Y0HP33_9CLOT|nr:amidase domain-containing protein [Clostridium muellerianum]NMM63287.1 amidase domain-containing protein [Clostridium muellerianum]
MIKKFNYIIFFTLAIIISFILGYKGELNYIKEAQLKKPSKVVSTESNGNRLYKNSAQINNWQKNKIVQSTIEPGNKKENEPDSKKQNSIENIDENQLKSELERIYNARSAAFVSGDVSPLKALFDTSQRYGKWALEHEIKRVKYLNDWANQRNITFGKVESKVRIKKIYPRGSVIRIALQESYKFDYVYNNDDNSPINSFGVGIRHTTSLTKKNEKWIIYNDWYTDCFEDALHGYSITTDSIPETTNTILDIDNSYKEVDYRKRFYDREKAAFYADKYCGAAWGSSNNFKYNKKYSDYNGIGGDCSNFASQVLGDKEGGGMPIGGSWTPGSRAWSNADGLKDYLISSGRGSVISVGTFKELTKSSERLPSGAVAKLQIGDLVAYEKGRGNIDHFAVVTGFDSHGYPLINSHTTDRYHVPWDLGWGDAKIRFFLIHING